MAPDLKAVADLQALDKRIEALRSEIASLPRQIANLEKTLEAHLRRLEADRAALVANQRERRQLEADIQTQEQKISKLKDQMMEARTNEQYRAFQKEIDYCQNEIRKAEDRILDLMAASEPLEQKSKAAEAALRDEQRQVEQAKQRTHERTAADKKSLEEALQQRKEVAASITASVCSAYERIRRKRHGQAVAEAVDGRCTACNLALRLQLWQDVRKNEQVMFCENCGRILYYNPPADFDQVASEPAEAHPLPPGP